MLTSVLAGALAGGLVSLLVNEFRDSLRIKRATNGLRLQPEGRAGTRVTARVKNDSNYCIDRATAYVTIHHELDDILSPPLHFAAFIGPYYRKTLQEDRLCWSVTKPERNPMSVDIYPGESQLLDLADFGARSEWIEVPSEMGWSSGQTAEQARHDGQISSRVFLRAGKKYRGSVKVVSKVTRARTFEIEIDPADEVQPVRLLA
jgi:hypothetical protein